MSQVHVVIDGSWLFKLCDKGKVFSKRAVHSRDNSVGILPFSLNFERLTNCIVKFLERNTGDHLDTGKLYLSTSIFDDTSCNPPFDQWVATYSDVDATQIEKMESGNFARQRFVENAERAQFNQDLCDVVYRPKLNIDKFRAWRSNQYREKQVDSTVVALLVKLAAVENIGDYTVVITGDLDILPAIKASIPDFTSKVALVTVHPDNLDAEDRVSSFELVDFANNTGLHVLYLDDVVNEIIHIPLGMTDAYSCDALHCGLAFTSNHINDGRQRFCPRHRPTRS